MARTIEEIKKEMTDAFLADSAMKTAFGLDSTKTWGEQFSKVCIENIIFYIVASAIWTLENLFDLHKEEISDTIGKRAHTLNWYREKALEFQFGRGLMNEIAEYDNSNVSDEQIERERIVYKCSAESAQEAMPTIIVKAVTTDGAMTEDQLSAFSAYMKEVADAGVQLNIVSEDPDKVTLHMEVWYDPLLINENGVLYNENIPEIVGQYVSDYFASLPYNGKLYPKLLESYLSTCDGVKMVKISKIIIGGDDYAGLDSITAQSGAFELYGKNFTYTQFS